MSVINIFEHNLETNVMKLVGSHLQDLAFNANIVRGEDNHVQALPLIIIHSVEGQEAVFQSGIYQVKLTATVKVDLDTGSPELSASLFGAVMDVFQYTDIIHKMNDLGGVWVQGAVLLDHNVADVGDRMWTKTVSMDFFGFAL